MTLTVERAIAHLNDARRALADLDATLANVRRRIGDVDIALDAAHRAMGDRPAAADRAAGTRVAEHYRAAERELELLNAARDRAEDELDQRMRDRSSAVLALHAAQCGAWSAIMDELAARLDWTAINAVVVAAAHARRPAPFKTDLSDIVGADDLTAALAARYGIPPRIDEESILPPPNRLDAAGRSVG